MAPSASPQLLSYSFGATQTGVTDRRPGTNHQHGVVIAIIAVLIG